MRDLRNCTETALADDLQFRKLGLWVDRRVKRPVQVGIDMNCMDNPSRPRDILLRPEELAQKRHLEINGRLVARYSI